MAKTVDMTQGSPVRLLIQLSGMWDKLDGHGAVCICALQARRVEIQKIDPLRRLS